MIWLRLKALRDAVAGWLRVPTNLALAVIAVFLVAAAVTVPVDRKGDGSEYILATESLYYDHDLVIDNPVDLFRHIEMRPQGMDTPAGLTAIEGRDGRLRYGMHSFYYPVACVPFYALFGYQGFYIFNALLVSATIAAVYAHFSRTQPRGRALALAAGGVFLSATWSYVFWTHTEDFYCALIAGYLYFYHGDRPRGAALCIGVALGAQFPLALLAIPLLAETVLRRRFRTAVQIVAIVALCAAPQIYYDLHDLGTLTPAARAGLASPKFISVEVWFRMLFDPAMGLFWFYPIAVYCLIRWHPSWRNISLLVATAAMLLAMTSTSVVYSHQVGTRYAVYALPVLLFGVGHIGLSGLWTRVSAAYTVVIGAGLALNPLGNSRDMDIRHKTFLPYRVASALGIVDDDPEVFRASSDVLVPDRVYSRKITRDLWTWGGERAELMLLRARTGVLELSLRSYPGMTPQRVEIRTRSGTKVETWLAPAEVTKVPVMLEPGDLYFYSRWNSAHSYVTIWAEPWSPSITEEGHKPEADDMRRLGVQVERITLDGETLLGP